MNRSGSTQTHASPSLGRRSRKAARSTSKPTTPAPRPRTTAAKPAGGSASACGAPQKLGPATPPMALPLWIRRRVGLRRPRPPASALPRRTAKGTVPQSAQPRSEEAEEASRLRAFTSTERRVAAGTATVASSRTFGRSSEKSSSDKSPNDSFEGLPRNVRSKRRCCIHQCRFGTGNWHTVHKAAVFVRCQRGFEVSKRQKKGKKGPASAMCERLHWHRPQLIRSPTYGARRGIYAGATPADKYAIEGFHSCRAHNPAWCAVPWKAYVL